MEQETNAAGEKALDRRSVVVAAAAAVSGAALAKLVDADEAQASHDVNVAYDSQTTMHTDVVNTTASSTRISTNISGTAPFVVLNNYPVGISRPDGILGRTTYTTSNCAGVAGACEAASGGIGVIGTANNSTGVGVFGFSGSSVPFEVPSAGTGVVGRGGTRGVSGESANGTGVHGSTAAGIGVRGVSTGAGPAGRFEGVLEVIGTVPAAEIQGSNGVMQRTYPTAGLSPAFEHVGQARLRNGRATVKLPAAFDTLVLSRTYQVFLSEYGDLGGLYISSRRFHAFDVRSRRSGAGGLFGYRIIALRPGLKN